MFYVFPDAHSLAEHASQLLYQHIASQPDSVLGLATGSTMEPVYQLLADKINQHHPDVSQLHTFNLDEYIGLSPAHPQSYNYYMHQHLFDKIALPEQQCHLPAGDCTNLEQECRNYSALIKQHGGLDLQLLGIGTNGHIGFNEPGTAFDSRTHVVELSANTIRDNSRFFDDKSQMPTSAITMGIQDIMEAKEILLLATGAHKAEVMAQLFASQPDENMPASILKQHQRISILLDSSAAALIPAHQLKRVSTP